MPNYIVIGLIVLAGAIGLAIVAKMLASVAHSGIEVAEHATSAVLNVADRVQEIKIKRLHASMIHAGDGSYLVNIDGRPELLQTIPTGPTVDALPAGEKQLALPAPDEELTIPRAPSFRAMAHLIDQSHRLVLCYTANGPAYGTVQDLLSMALIGKPGRGKTTALLYYIAMLLNIGAEVHVWDPHGSISELAGLPKLIYSDEIERFNAEQLQQELETRRILFRETKKVKHPLLLLVDELPVIGDWQKKNKTTVLTDVMQRFVLEARKWNCFFIASGQSTDAEILPTRVSENLSSRIVFFSSDRRARMAGLENDAIKKFLPVIRRAGAGVMIFDCSTWDGPVLGAIPETTVEDMRWFLTSRSTSHDLPAYMPPLPGKFREVAQEADGRNDGPDTEQMQAQLKTMLRQIGKKLKSGEVSRAEILKEFEATSGRANQEIGAVLDALREEM